MTSHGQNDRHPVLTHLDGSKIPNSELDQLRLQPDILGVRYVEETSRVQVLFQVSFPVLKKRKHYSDARLLFHGLRSKDPVVHMRVETLTSEVREVVEVGTYVYTKDTSFLPKSCRCGSPCCLVECEAKESITQRHHLYSLLAGCRAMAGCPDATWSFGNVLGKELQVLYPSHICLITEFASPPDSVKDKAPFYFVFSIDGTMTFMDRIRSIFRHAFVKDHYQYEIPGPYREDVVEEHILQNKCGLRAAMEHHGPQSSVKRSVKYSNLQRLYTDDSDVFPVSNSIYGHPITAQKCSIGCGLKGEFL